jgi:hypothetical protein
MAKKYTSTLTSKLTPDNWQEHINIAALSLDELTDLLGDFKAMEAFGKQLGGFLKEAVKAKLPQGQSEFVGRHFQFVINARVRAGGLNKELITQEMGEEWVQEHSLPPTEYEELRLTPVKTD